MRISVIVPTWNERENIGPLLSSLAEALQGYDYEVVVVDDGSPDGTAEAVRGEALRNGHIKLLERQGRRGLASAVLAGLSIASGQVVVMMDADLSHDPREIPHLLEKLEAGYDVSIGSRYIKGGKTRGWSVLRRVGSRVATLLARLLLRPPVKDPLSGFAAFRREVLENLPTSYSSGGFKLLLEVLATSPGVRVAEVPILFTGRERGSSKMGPREVLEFLRLSLRLFLWRLRQGRG
jgi:dolichol-phosphate mannosyltransferase